MKFKYFIYAAIVLAGVTACGKDSPSFTVGEADNAILLQAGIADGTSAEVHTKASGSSSVDANHSKHAEFLSGTVASLRVDGLWIGHSPSAISQTTTATLGGLTSAGSKHSSMAMSPQLYWDDYGTADPANMGDAAKGREKGLTIYGAAVNGVESAPAVTDFTALEWTLDADQSGQDYWKNKDLLISNNIRPGVYDDTYKFDERSAGKLMEFKHAMSMVTVRLIANAGFPTSGVGGTTYKFARTPEVRLTSNKTGESNAEWPLTTCTVNVTDGAVSNPATPSAIEMHANTPGGSDYTVVFDALVAPGSEFKNASTIARINADGNVYYLTSAKIREKMHSLDAGTDYKTESGKNYILTVIVNKTGISVTATISGWVDVTAETVTPVISVDSQVGTQGSSSTALTAFDFYMSETTASTGYSKYAKAEGTSGGASVWQFKDGSGNNMNLYWPSHDTHYFMRGVSPVGVAVAGTEEGIAVTNLAYNAGNFPCNLMIGAPEFASSTPCDNPDHTSVDMATSGICARNNTINLNFRYAMSQIEVRLTSSGTVAEKNLVNIDSNSSVEIAGGYSKGTILLGTRAHDSYTDADKPDGGSYMMHAATVGGYNYAVHDVVMPQVITDDMKFKVKIKNSDDSYDYYTAQINLIKVSGASDKITEWEPGKHYVYVLDLLKTQVNVTATLTDWTPVNASENIWF